MLIARRHATLRTYRPDIEDWIWNVVLPLAAYTTLAASAMAMRAPASGALYATAAAAMLLIFIGIHNAWDVVTFLATGKAEELPDSPPADGAENANNLT